MAGENKISSTDVVTQEKVKLKKPKLYRVILLNDDYTPMEYVVSLLKIVFKKSESEAVNIMLMVHKKGSGICGIFTKEIAETKVETVLNMAKSDQHPLKCIMEID
jgi:ATP-dependent Clp protease adaptor protein ClpS